MGLGASSKGSAGSKPSVWRRALKLVDDGDAVAVLDALNQRAVDASSYGVRVMALVFTCAEERSVL